jgi:hypothetical protein
MRALVTLVLGIILLNSAYADGVANLRIKVSNQLKNNDYFLCLPDAGCFSIAAAAAGKVYKIDSGTVTGLLTADVPKGRLYAQDLPKSCQVTVDGDRTLTISGKLRIINARVDLTQVHCQVT